MCGIAGMINRTGAPVNEADLQTMLGAISHRGPDGTGICLRGPIGLAMTRLAIIDVSGGNRRFITKTTPSQLSVTARSTTIWYCGATWKRKGTVSGRTVTSR